MIERERKEKTDDVDVWPRVRDRDVFAVVREAERRDAVPGARARDGQLLRGGVGVGSRSGTYSQLVMVRAQIHSDRSNMFTMESWPPDARYLAAVNTAVRENESL